MKTQIPNNYPSLNKYSLHEILDELTPSQEMLELLKIYLPQHICTGTVWSKKKPIELAETERLSSDLEALKKQILDFDFFGTIAFKINGFPILVKIDYDEFGDKDIDVIETAIIEYEYEFFNV